MCLTALPLSHRASWSVADGLSPPPSSSLRPGTFFSSCYLETRVELWVKEPPCAAARSASRLAPSCCCCCLKMSHAGGAENEGCSARHDTSPVAKILLRILSPTNVPHTSDGVRGRVVTDGSLTQFAQQPLSKVLLGAGQRQRADEGRGRRLGVRRPVWGVRVGLMACPKYARRARFQIAHRPLRNFPAGPRG